MHIEYELNSFPALDSSGFHKVAYRCWGGPDRESAVVCVHGLSRNAGDFDSLARTVSRTRRVVCPDIAGRGQSDWLSDASSYGYPTYLSDMAALIARLDVPVIDWVGTSMGGLIGLQLAARDNSPVRRLVLNDVGPFVPSAPLRDVRDTLDGDCRFVDLDEAESYYRDRYAGFGELTDAQWRKLTNDSIRPSDGGYAPAFDPRLKAAMPVVETDVDLWEIWARVECPVLVLRGAESSILTSDTAKRMVDSHPATTLIEIDGVGHAPPLLDDYQIGAVADWLAG